MIYFTGPTKSRFVRLSEQWLLQHGLTLTSEDYLVVCGNLGYFTNSFFMKYRIEEFEKLPYTVLWLQGDIPEDADAKEYPAEEWHGGMVRHILRDKLIMLESGQIFDICGKKLFVFGTVDDEETREDVMCEGLDRLTDCRFKVDYIATYGPLADFEQIRDVADYAIWFSGFSRRDEALGEKRIALCHAIYNPLAPIDLSEVPVPGQPKFQVGDRVSFRFKDTVKTGRVRIVDAYGTFDQSEEPSYDVLVEEDDCLYKHFNESLLRRADEKD